MSIFDVGVTDTEMPVIIETEFHYALKTAKEYWEIRNNKDIRSVPVYYNIVIHDSCKRARVRLQERGIDLNRNKHFRH